MTTFGLKGGLIGDLHVQALIYSVGAEGGTEYVDPEPLDVQCTVGRIRIDKGKLRIEPVEHYSTEDEAKAAVGPFLLAWQMDADLRAMAPGTIRFKFESSEIIDRNPPPPGTSAPRSPELRTQAMVSIAGNLVFNRSFKSYPPPPHAFSTSPDVDDAFNRWRQYRHGLEPLLGMAYYILTLIESQTKPTAAQVSSRRRTTKRAAAATLYAIDADILDKVGELSSERGDASTARKFDAGKRALTDAERLWLEKIVVRLITRLGEHASGGTLVPITQNELPLP